MASLKTKDIALISIFSAMWVVLQSYFGPIVGHLSIGFISFHGSVNRLAGWLLMTVLTEQVTGFGRITLMATVAATITRILRANILEGVIVGLGYVVGGFTFDALVNLKPSMRVRKYFMIALISGFMASTPYLTTKIYFLGFPGFMVASPMYIFSTVKGMLFSLLGTSLGVSINETMKRVKLTPNI